jgi:tetratricopeptide (TPR) repeat protein
MISCKECETLNSLDSAFCKKCGKPLAQEDSLDAREKLEKQLHEGFDLFHHGRTDEAALLAESSLASDPTNLRALSLRGMILERKGLIAEALETYETIVARDPNAALERMKLQTLRGALDAKGFGAPQANKKLALIVAACAVLVVTSLSALAAITLLGNRRADTETSMTPNQPVYKADTFAGGEQATQTIKEKASSDQPGSQAPAPGSAPQSSPPAQQTLQGELPANSALPKPSNSESTQISPLDPLKGAQIQQLPANIQSSSPAVQNTAAPTQTQPDPDPSAVVPKDERPPEPQPVVDIKLSNGEQGSASEMGIDRNGVEAMVRSATGQFMVGNYQAAAGTYARALNAGADPALINQHLGQCYEHLGRNSDAIDAYSKAIAASLDSISRGKGNKARLTAVLESSRQALKNLQGG